MGIPFDGIRALGELESRLVDRLAVSFGSVGICGIESWTWELVESPYSGR